MSDSASDPADKRAHQRLPFVVRVDFADRVQFLGATENLSKGGLFIQTDHPFSIGERIPLALSFPGLLDPVEVTGRITWVRPANAEGGAGVGVSVDADEDRRRIASLVNAAQAPPPAQVTAPAAGYRVLIVEDNPHIIEMYSYVLKKLAQGEKVPLEVHFASDGHDALRQFQERSFSLVLTDLYMPVMDGFALIEHIRKDPRLKDLPLVAISAGGKDAQNRALDAGVDIYLRKPVKFVEVLETVKSLLRIK